MPLLLLARSPSTPDAGDGFLPVLGNDGDPSPYFPEIRVSVAFDSKPRDYPQVYTRITQYVRAITTGPRGRQPLADRPEAARLSLTLDNSTRTFDATNVAGPYFGKLKTNKRVQIDARWNGVVYPIIECLVDEWPQSWPGVGTDAIVQLSATDKFKMLGRFDLPASFYVPQGFSGAQVEAALDAAGQPAAERDIDAGMSELVAQGATHSGVVTAASSVIVGGLDGTDDISEGMAVYGTGIPDNTTVVHIGPFTDDTEGTGLVLAANEIALSKPAAVSGVVDLVFTSGDSISDTLSFAQKVGDSERGLLFVGPDGKWVLQGRTHRLNGVSLHTFGDGAGELPYTDVVPSFTDQDLANDVHVSLPDQLEAVATDADSEDDNGPVSWSLDTFLVDRNQAVSIAEYELSRRKDSQNRLEALALDGAADPDALWPVILGIEVSDRITVKRRPPGGGDPQTYVCDVENISHVIAPGRWTTTLQLSPSDTSSYWVLGTSLLGTDTRLSV